MAPSAPKQRLRVAYVVGQFPSLSETFVVNQIVAMAAAGHSVDIYATTPGPAEAIPGDVVRYRLPERTHSLVAPPGMAGRLSTLWLLLTVGWRAPRVLWRFAIALSRTGLPGSGRLLHAAMGLIRRDMPEYDVVHAQFGPLGCFAMQLVDLGVLRGALVTSFRGYDLGKYLRTHPRAYADLLRRGALFLPVSEALAGRLRAEGADHRQVRVHRSGIWCRRLSYRPRRANVERVRLVSVARLVEKKGIAYAIHAVAKLTAAGRNVHYTVIGDGPLRASLESLVWELGLGSRVRLAGAKKHSEAIDMLRASDILLAPSVTAADGDEEGIPNAMKEAMALGLPVIGTRHGGIPELVEDGLCGLLVPERDVDALAERIGYLIDRPDVWSRLAEAGRARIEAEYDIERLNDELVVLYRRAMERAAPAGRALSLIGAKPDEQGVRRA